MAFLKLVSLFKGLSTESLIHRLYVDVLRTVEVLLCKDRRINCSPRVLWGGVYWDRPISEEVSLMFL